MKECPACKVPDPWADWRERFLYEQAKRRKAEGEVDHLKACLRKLARAARQAIDE